MKCLVSVRSVGGLFPGMAHMCGDGCTQVVDLGVKEHEYYGIFVVYPKDSDRRTISSHVPADNKGAVEWGAVRFCNSLETITSG